MPRRGANQTDRAPRSDQVVMIPTGRTRLARLSLHPLLRHRALGGHGRIAVTRRPDSARLRVRARPAIARRAARSRVYEIARGRREWRVTVCVCVCVCRRGLGGGRVAGNGYGRAGGNGRGWNGGRCRCAGWPLAGGRAGGRAVESRLNGPGRGRNGRGMATGE